MYLDLTATQTQSIGRNQTEYSEFLNSRNQRAYQVSNELAEERRRDPADAMALGVRYVELETIRREIAAKDAGRRQANRSLLTPAQLSKLPSLEQAQLLQPLASEAECTGLAAPTETLALPGSSTIFVSNVVSISPFCMAPGPPIALSVYLNLTARQEADMSSAAADFRIWLESTSTRAERLRVEAETLTRADTLDPGAIGARYADIEVLTKEVEREKARVAARIRSFLTDAQRDRLRTVAVAASLAPVSSQAVCLGLIDQVTRFGGLASAGIFTGSFACGF